MILSLVKIYPAPGVEQNVLDVLNSMKGPMAALSDCLGCSVMVEPEEGGAICYTEQWRTREALDKHLRSALYGRLLEAIEHSSHPPEVFFYEVTRAGGLEWVEKARNIVADRMKEPK